MEAKYYKKPNRPNIIMSRRRSGYAHLFKLAYIIGELLLVNLSLIMSFYLVYDTDIPTFDLSFSHYQSTMPFIVAASLLYIDYLGMTHFFRKNKTDMILASFQVCISGHHDDCSYCFCVSMVHLPSLGYGRRFWYHADTYHNMVNPMS